MDSWQIKATPIEGLWEVARLEKVIKKKGEKQWTRELVPDKRIMMFAEWLVEIPPAVFVDEHRARVLEYSLTSTGDPAWHVDGLDHDLNYLLIMCHSEPTTEFSKVTPLELGIGSGIRYSIASRSSLINDLADSLVDFVAEPCILYLASSSVIHRAPPLRRHSSSVWETRLFSRIAIHWDRPINAFELPQR